MILKTFENIKKLSLAHISDINCWYCLLKLKICFTFTFDASITLSFGCLPSDDQQATKYKGPQNFKTLC